jgi:signal transduction histidine kinase
MLKRLRQLRISLAAKCQLLFGAAVVLIIAAALLVPWQRMEQLTQQLNERSASVLVEQIVQRHVASRVGHLTQPDTEPAGGLGSEDVVTRLIRLAPLGSAEGLTRFEKTALAHYLKDGDPDFGKSYERKDGTGGYRYARIFQATQQCAACHGEAASQPTTAVAAFGEGRWPRLLGIVSVDIPSQVDANQLQLNRVFILMAGALAGALATIVFYLITTRLILQPVRVLQETAEKVSEGDLNIRSDISTGDEFQQLSETFNTMLTNLKASQDQLRGINKSLDLKLGQLAETNVALYESNRLKSEFLANVSHELRTPLNSILGFAELVKDSLSPEMEGKTVRYIQNILSSGRNLLDLINDLLDLAKIEAGRMEVRSEPLSLSDLFEGLTSILKPLLEPKALSVDVEVGKDVPILQTDAAKLQQVLYNFLSNAIKFSPAGGRIELVASRDGEEHVRIAVTDHGPGIDADKQEVIFEKFRQLDGGVTRQHSGTGLGLAISRELTVLLGGSIGVRSTPGEGATFWVVLPLKVSAGTVEARGRFVLT